MDEILGDFAGINFLGLSNLGNFKGINYRE